MVGDEYNERKGLILCKTIKYGQYVSERKDLAFI